MNKNSYSRNRSCFFGFDSWVFIILLEILISSRGFINILESHGIKLLTKGFRNEHKMSLSSALKEQLIAVEILKMIFREILF